MTPTLWDLIRAPGKKRVKPAKSRPSAPTTKRSSRAAKPGPMQEKYDAMTRAMLAEYGVRVRKWRSAMTGVAWIVYYHDGSETRLIEAPRPRGPMSAAIFLHEIGHHAIGFSTYTPRCLEEYHAWAWSLATMERLGLNITDGVRARVHDSLWYAVAKAQRRGLKRLPEELEPYIRPHPRHLRRVAAAS